MTAPCPPLDAGGQDFYKRYSSPQAWIDWMEQALAEAGRAEAAGEVPVGALVLDSERRQLAAASNRPIAANDPTAHAEVLALRAAASRVGNYRLPGAILICTLEPCLMCLGALVQARVQGVVFATRDPRYGAVVSRFDCQKDLEWLNHRFWVVEGVLEEKSREMLQRFFAQRR